MDLTAYINSGVLELYVLDRLSPDERRRVEAYAEQYPEVREEIEQIEIGLEEYALLQGQATPPPPEVLTSVLSRIRPTTSSPAAPATSEVTSGGSGWVTWLMLALLALTLAALAYFYLEHRERQDELQDAREELSIMQASCAQIASEYEADREQLAVLTDVDTRGILLSGSDNAPESRALVFYNETDGTVLFSAANLPPPPAGKQYQLWAIDAQGPQDLGVLDRDLSQEALLNVPFVPNAAAFAITLEDEGGKPTPDLTQLQVIGEVGS
ncbi:anti-sigma factor [Neolewinella litorea]|uniref:Regulator of SigK n=1 Tax=Neolewinella litorea TaxID=2562452 RepID=A0A4S4NNI5_9BACT|nr:anti-sigma factor [Neolewinella litorea]THH41559.1 anti-sigma factor [Neolewinella litorea]